MSVRTDADEKLEEASDHLKKAWQLMKEAIDPDTYGSNDFKDEFVNSINEYSNKIYLIYRKINFK